MLQQENADSLWKDIDQDGGYIYVCGATSMGHDVHAALKTIAMNHGKFSY